jgi:hypothetical protein
MGSFKWLYDDMNEFYVHWYNITNIVNSYGYDTFKMKMFDTLT